MTQKHIDYLKTINYDDFKKMHNNKIYGSGDKALLDFEMQCTILGLKQVVVAAFGISHCIYKDETYKEKVITTYYTNRPDYSSFIGVKIEIKFED